jgi:hypothetical protein
MADQELDRQRASGLMDAFPGWRVWSSNARGRYATRKRPVEPAGDDTDYARTLDAGNWTGLEDKLTAQRANDGARGYP